MTEVTYSQIEAKVEAAARSKANKSTVYIVANEDGDCLLKDKPQHPTLFKYKNGSEVALSEEETKFDVNPTAPSTSAKVDKKTKKQVQAAVAPAIEAQQQIKSTNKTKKTMATPAKKTAKKAAKKAAKVAKKSTAARPAVEGKKKSVTIKEMVTAITKGTARFYNHANKVLTPQYLKNMKDQTREMEVTVVEVK